MLLLAAGTEDIGEICSEDKGGGSRERSSMKLPAARLAGVRGRWRWTVMSYGCRDARDELDDDDEVRYVVEWGNGPSTYCR